MIELRPDQVATVEKGYEILKRYNLLYLAAQVRTGKSVMSMTIAKKMGWRKVCFVTKKMAISSIKADYTKLGHEFQVFHVTNFEQAPNLFSEYDGFIIDEATTCFPAGTLIDGIKIEELLLHHSLNSYNLDKDLIERKKILNVIENENDYGWVKITSDGKTVVCTHDHLFFSKRGWIKAIDINYEDELFVV